MTTLLLFAAAGNLNAGGATAFSVFSNAFSFLMIIAGLGIVIFVHELGHFAVAKWCNVLVERFSIGFGRVLWGWKWGETEYCFCLLPFGGYVKMLGQDDSDPGLASNPEVAGNPRSYLAKNTWQRMAIISAGVIMNLITSVFFFAIAFRLGAEDPPAEIGAVYPGGAAWVAGMERGDIVESINGKPIKRFMDVALKAALSDEGQSLLLAGLHADGKPFESYVVPIKGKADTRPSIGVEPSFALRLSREGKGPPFVGAEKFPAAMATPKFAPGDVIVAIDGHELAKFSDFQNQLALRTRDESTITVARVDPANPDEKPKKVDITVGSVYFRTLGIHLDCGPISAIQHGSVAEKAGLKVGDKIAKVNGKAIGTEIDPFRLPSEFTKWAGEKVILVVTRPKQQGPQEEITVELTPAQSAPWNSLPYQLQQPLTISSIGIAYPLIPRILHVVADSPADKEKITPQTTIEKMELISQAAQKDVRNPGFIATADTPEAGWASILWLLQTDRDSKVKLTLKEGDSTRLVELTPLPDETWRLPLIGIQTELLFETHQSENFAVALTDGFHESTESTRAIYMTLRGLFTGRLSFKEMHGPVGIISEGKRTADRGPSPLLRFLGFLSVNLAVLNFLPIPVLDGGHMVFLIWETITRRKPSMKVVLAASNVGLFLLLGLIVAVLFLDFGRILSQLLGS